MAYVNYEGAIQECLTAIYDQEERVRYLSLSDRRELHESATRTLVSMYHTLQTAREAQLSHHRVQRRGLYRDLMYQFAKRGAMLAALSASELAIVLRKHDISTSEAAACMKLHRNWRAFVIAERYTISYPTTVDEALALLQE